MGYICGELFVSSGWSASGRLDPQKAEQGNDAAHCSEGEKVGVCVPRIVQLLQMRICCHCRQLGEHFRQRISNVAVAKVIRLWQLVHSAKILRLKLVILLHVVFFCPGGHKKAGNFGPTEISQKNVGTIGK